jgi:HPt (histidine-containing phosphotransfer) domain-containing protein
MWPIVMQGWHLGTICSILGGIFPQTLEAWLPVAEQELVNIEMCRKIWAIGQSQLLGKLIEIFKTKSPARSIGMRTALAQNDFEALEHLSHSLKSSAANLGIDPVRDLCQKIELAASSKQTGDVSKHLLSLDLHLESVSPQLDSILQMLTLEESGS